ncbi:hypothetical protein [Helicobacter salomonis]|uniref:hypothetical protein n=1 Tax=Helicobacter salomonis TaxID=56878 RepID=UPI00131509B7|nr:hypothetical protein [Helicobacter salomonis]
MFVTNNNCANIEYKFVWGAPKNLIAAFHLTQKDGVIVFYDEMDRFLGVCISDVTQSTN